MDLKERIAAELGAVRDRSLGLTTDVLDERDLTAQVSPLMSPLVWDLAHVGNYEELWLLRALGAEPMRPDLDDLYNAFAHPRAERPSLRLLTPTQSRAYIGAVRDRVLDALDKARLTGPLGAGGFVYGMVLQHEHQHDETMLATHQLRADGPALLDPPSPPATAAAGAAAPGVREADGMGAADPRGPGAGTYPGPVGGRATGAPARAGLPEEVLVDGGPFLMGTWVDPWAYDNERGAHAVDLPAFHIDTTPVSNAAYLAFIADGGYDDPRWWRPAGWDWRNATGERAPAFWRREAGRWLRRRFGRIEPVPGHEPVQHVCWFEADAYARWAGKRLPTEAEWEKAASWDPATGRKRRLPWLDPGPGAPGVSLGPSGSPGGPSGPGGGAGAPAGRRSAGAGRSADGDPGGDLDVDGGPGEGGEPAFWAADGRANLGQRMLRPAPVGSFPAGASAYGVRQMLGDVWEWTASDFTGYPGFRLHPYKEYSQVFFGGDYKVLRGGSWATHPLACRTTFRNWDFPIRRQIFAGFRCARDA